MEDRDAVNNQLLFHLCLAFMGERIRTQAYRESMVRTKNGAEIHLIDSLAVKLAETLQDELDAKQLSLNPVLVSAIVDGRYPRQPVAAHGKKASKELYLYALHKDLVDERSPRHQAALEDLWIHANEHLKQGKFYGKKALAFNVMVDLAADLGNDERELINEFWDKSVWPHTVRKITTKGKPLSHPLKLHAYLQDRADGYLSHKARDIWVRRKNTSYLTAVDLEEGERLPSNSIHIDSAQLRVFSGQNSKDPTFSEVLDRIAVEDYVRGVLLRLTSGDHADPLGLLVFLLRYFVVPNMTGINSQASGKNQQIALLLEAWRTDPDLLEDYRSYLINPHHGCGMKPELVDEIIGVIRYALDRVPENVTSRNVTVWLNRFTAIIDGDESVHQSRNAEESRALDATGGGN